MPVVHQNGTMSQKLCAPEIFESKCQYAFVSYFKFTMKSYVSCQQLWHYKYICKSIQVLLTFTHDMQAKLGEYYFAFKLNLNKPKLNLKKSTH